MQQERTPEGQLGERHEPETHLIPLVPQAASGGRPHVTVFGQDYNTPDGTCVRDYIHVEDIARAHVMALDPKIPADIYNLSTGKGTSNAEIVDAAKAITNRLLNIVIGPRRAGDPDELTASADKFKRVAGEWQRWNLNDMIRHAWNWYV